MFFLIFILIHNKYKKNIALRQKITQLRERINHAVSNLTDNFLTPTPEIQKSIDYSYFI